MPTKKRGDRVTGPYEETERGKTRWRLVVYRGETVQRPVFDTLEGEDGALEWMQKIEANIAAATGVQIDAAIIEWERWRRGEGVKESTLYNCAHQVRGFFGAENLRRPLSWLAAPTRAASIRNVLRGTTGLGEASAPNRGATLYEALRARPVRQTGGKRAAATHKAALRIARQFLAWCVSRKLLKENPLAEVKASTSKATGQRTNRRKNQLTIDEGKQFFDLAERLANEGDEGALAALTAFILGGLRQSELTERVVRDLDDGGKLLRIDEGKTDASRGNVQVPEVLRAPLLRLARGKAPLAPLFESTVRQGHAYNPNWLRDQVRRLCMLSGLGLRPSPTVPAIKKRVVVRAEDKVFSGYIGRKDPDGSFMLVVASTETLDARGEGLLDVIAHQPGLSQRQMAERLCCAKSTIGRDLQALREKGLIAPYEKGFAVTEQAAAVPRFTASGFVVEVNSGGRLRLRFPPGMEVLVPNICAHSLRGMAATWLESAGAAPHIIASMLRHGDKGRIAEEHYIDPRAAQQSQRDRLLKVLGK